MRRTILLSILFLMISCQTYSQILKGKIMVKAPARIHLTVLDMNRFAPDHPGGGGTVDPLAYPKRITKAGFQ